MRGKNGLYDTLCLRAQRAALPECPFNNKTLMGVPKWKVTRNQLLLSL